MKSTIYAGLVAAFAAIAAAAQTGNPIYTPGLNQQVPAGKPFTITWGPSSPGPVSLIFLSGPATNVVPIGTIVTGIANSGSYVWTPSASLDAAFTGYAIKLVDETTGDYQYTTQFGISNDSPAVVSPSTPATVKPEDTQSTNLVNNSVKKSPTLTPTVTYSTHYETVTSCNCEDDVTSVVAVPTSTGTGVSTGVPVGEVPTYGNGTVPVKPQSSNYAAPNSTAPSPSDVIFTGAASQMKAGGALVAIVAAMAVFFF